MILLVNICMAILFFCLGGASACIAVCIGKALEGKRAAKKALEDKMEKLEELLKSNLDKNEK